MPEFVRVRQSETGHELSVTKGQLTAAPKGAYEVLDKPATYPAGDPLPPKYRRTVEEAAAAKKTTAKKAAESKAPTDQSATTSKEN